MAQFHRTKTAGVYVRHKNDCNAAFGEGRCRCEPSYRGKRRSPTTGKPEWSKTSKDRSEILTWLGAGEKAKPAVAERAEEGRSFGSLADEWIDGVSTGRIQRRRQKMARTRIRVASRAPALTTAASANHRPPLDPPAHTNARSNSITQRDWRDPCRPMASCEDRTLRDAHRSLACEE